MVLLRKKDYYQEQWARETRTQLLYGEGLFQFPSFDRDDRTKTVAFVYVLEDDHPSIIMHHVRGSGGARARGTLFCALVLNLHSITDRTTDRPTIVKFLIFDVCPALPPSAAHPRD